MTNSDKIDLKKNSISDSFKDNINEYASKFSPSFRDDLEKINNTEKEDNELSDWPVI